MLATGKRSLVAHSMTLQPYEWVQFAPVVITAHRTSPITSLGQPRQQQRPPRRHKPAAAAPRPAAEGRSPRPRVAAPGVRLRSAGEDDFTATSMFAQVPAATPKSMTTIIRGGALPGHRNFE